MAGLISGGAALSVSLTPAQLREVLASEPGRAVEVATHPASDDPLRQWLWQQGDDDLRAAMYRHYLEQKGRLAERGLPLPEAALRYDLALLQLSASLGAPNGEAVVETQIVNPARGSVIGAHGAPGAPGAVAPIAAVPATSTLGLLRFADGRTVDLTAPQVVIGRRPSAERYPQAQLLAVQDPGKELSSMHILLERVGRAWQITDLGSTNGTRLGATAQAPLATPGVPHIAPDAFLIGGQLIELLDAR